MPVVPCPVFLQSLRVEFLILYELVKVAVFPSHGYLDGQMKLGQREVWPYKQPAPYFRSVAVEVNADLVCVHLL